MLLKKDFVGGLRATLIQDQGQIRNLESKIYLPGFHRFKFEFHSFFAETFSTVSVIHVALVASVNRPHVRFASESDRIAAHRAGTVAYVTIISTLSRTNSAAMSAARSARPSAQRYSIATV